MSKWDAWFVGFCSGGIVMWLIRAIVDYIVRNA